jgi:IclR helix-turn-helix domain
MTEPVLIELTEAQVDRVVRGASTTGSMSMLLSGVSDAHETIAAAQRHLDDTRLSRSLLFGLLLLSIFPADGSYLGNAEVARMLGLGMSTTHRYISTLVVVGLLERNPTTRQYRVPHAG